MKLGILGTGKIVQAGILSAAMDVSGNWGQGDDE